MATANATTTNHSPVDMAAIMALPKAKRGPKYITICCPFHNDSNPSCGVKHSPPYAGGFKCLSCGEKGGWDKLAAKLGINSDFVPTPDIDTAGYEASFFEPIERVGAKVTKTKTTTTATTSSKKNKGMPGDFIYDWRGFENKFLKDLGAVEIVEPWGEKMLKFPVLIRGKEVGFLRARIKKVKGKPSYLNKPGKWSGTHGLFLYDQSIALMRKLKIKAMVLVEGPRDALRLYRSGIPVMSILGTQSWSEEKRMLLELADIDRVVLCMDGDKAGFVATKMLKASLGIFFDVVSMDLWEYSEDDVDLDPCNMPAKLVKRLKVLATI